MRKRLPEWFKIKMPSAKLMAPTKSSLERWRLHTVCEEAKCPNSGECWSKGTATVLIMGDYCTRGCRFCAVKKGRPSPLDPDEPNRVARAAMEMGLRYVVITSVTRDDLPDGGAGHFAATIQAIRRQLPESRIEVLIPDFQGSTEALTAVVEARPDVLGHNLETVPSLYRRVRPQADYQRSLGVLAKAKELDPTIVTKSGIMLGLGEGEGEVRQVLADLIGVGCDICTLGQYLSPSDAHLPVEEFIHPDMFQHFARLGEEMGMPRMVAGPLVRSSYLAEEAFFGRV